MEAKEVLLALADLQNSLQEINSAKDQVAQVVNGTNRVVDKFDSCSNKMIVYTDAIKKLCLDIVETYKLESEAARKNLDAIGADFDKSINKLDEDIEALNKAVTLIINCDFTKSAGELNRDILDAKNEITRTSALLEQSTSNQFTALDNKLTGFESLANESREAKHKLLIDQFTELQSKIALFEKKVVELSDKKHEYLVTRLDELDQSDRNTQNELIELRADNALLHKKLNSKMTVVMIVNFIIAIMLLGVFGVAFKLLMK